MSSSIVRRTKIQIVIAFPLLFASAPTARGLRERLAPLATSVDLSTKRNDAQSAQRPRGTLPLRDVLAVRFSLSGFVRVCPRPHYRRRPRFCDTFLSFFLRFLPKSLLCTRLRFQIILCDWFRLSHFCRWDGCDDPVFPSDTAILEN